MADDLNHIANIHITSGDVIDWLATQELTSNVATVSYLAERYQTMGQVCISSLREFIEKRLTNEQVNLPEALE